MPRLRTEAMAETVSDDCSGTAPAGQGHCQTLAVHDLFVEWRTQPKKEFSDCQAVINLTRGDEVPLPATVAGALTRASQNLIQLSMTIAAEPESVLSRRCGLRQPLRRS